MLNDGTDKGVVEPHLERGSRYDDIQILAYARIQRHDPADRFAVIGV